MCIKVHLLPASCHVTSAEIAPVLCCLCRVAFWRQVTVQPDTALAGQYACGFQQQHGFGSSSPLSDQLHQLAWSSILITSKRHRVLEQEEQQLRWQHQQQHAGCEEAGPLAELKQKLRAYLAAHMQWRWQQRHAPPLAPAEKWVTLEHAEQVGLHASPALCILTCGKRCAARGFTREHV